MNRVAKIALWAALAVAAYTLVAFVISVGMRVVYPYELEWMEGAMLRIVARSANGEPLYVEPTLDFAMSVYAPLYYWTAGLVTGSGEVTSFTPARLVSVAAVVVGLALIWRFVRRSGGSRVAAIFGIAFYCGCFGLGDAYHDTVHSDSMLVMWLLASLYALRFWNGMPGALASGGFLALAFATKQSAMLAPGLMFVACWWARRDWKQALALLLAAVVPAATWLGVLHSMSDGWSSYFLLGQLSGHEIEQNMVRGYWTFDIGKGVPLAFLSATVFMFTLMRRGDWVAAPTLGVAATIMVGISYGSRLHRGGAENVLYPMFAVLAFLGALGLDRALRSERAGPRLAGAMLCLLQLGMLLYNPSRQNPDGGAWIEPLQYAPSAEQVEAGDRMVTALRNLDGQVLVPFHGQVAAFAGIAPCAHPVTINDVLRAEDDVAAAFRTHLRERIGGHAYDRIVTEDTVTDPWWRALVLEHYRHLDRGPLIEEPYYRWVAARGAWPMRILVPMK